MNSHYSYPSTSCGHSTRKLATLWKTALLLLCLLLTLPLSAADNSQPLRTSEVQNAAGAGGISTPGMVESRSGGFKFPDGSVQSSAAVGTVTSITAGSGLNGGSITSSGTLSVDTSQIQTRVSGACAAGSSIRSIASDGSVNCETDDVGASVADLNTHSSNSSAHHSRYADAEAVTAIKAADGTGSGLDADLLDGMHASDVIDAAINAVRTPIDSLPYSITQSGSYYVTGNLDGSGGGITIHASDVTLDLMGFTLDGGGSNNRGILVANIQQNLTIKNGTIRNFGEFGIKQSTAASGGIRGSKTRILNMRIIANGALISYGDGINTNATDAVVENCVVEGNRGDGIDVSATATVRNNRVSNNGRRGIQGGELIVGNVISSNGASSSSYDAIDADNAVIINNVIRNNHNSGIYGSGLLVKDNIVESNNQADTLGNAGIEVFSDSRVIGNTLRDNKQDGIRVSSWGNVLIDNHITGTNPGNGISFYSSSNYYRDNTANGNGTDFYMVGYTITDGGGNAGF